MTVELKLAVSGATGWLGSELIRYVQSHQKFSRSNIVAITSQNGVLQVEKNIIKLSKFDSLSENLEIDYYFDFAFVTREKFPLLGPKKYKEVNLKIIENSVKFIKNYKPKAVLLASSGAVYKLNKIQHTIQNTLYSELKQFQEIEISEACRSVNSSLVTSRIFNLAGSGIRKVDTFAIAEFVYRGIHNQDILIKSDFPVIRRYCDISQFLSLVFYLTLNKESITFDTGGIKIEIRELAKIVVDKLNSNSKIKTIPINKNLEADNYFSNNSSYEDLLEKLLSLKPSTIYDQVELTKIALLKR
jgi:nucleoside-diphosphate-sugar epimerase